MKFDALFEAGFKELGARFFLIAFLPILSVALLIVSLDASGAPDAPPSWARFVRAMNDFDLTKWVGLIFVVLVLAFVTMPLQDALVRIVEGYWGRLATGGLGRCCVRYQQGKRAKLVDAVQNLPDNPTASQKLSTDSAARRLSKYYPSDADRVLPTGLGNALRAAEDLATSRYGLDAVVMWPRLYPYIDAALGGLVDSARNQFDVSIRLVPTFVICAAVSLGFLHGHGVWLAMPAGFALMAILGYRASIEAAAAFGVVMNAAIDLHRFDMLEGLHLPMPADLDAEKTSNRAISDFLRQGIAHGLPYAHPPKPEPHGGGADAGGQAGISGG
ncbi:hypothetical protein [Burkholderia alba]|uniref:hypothetical protein n=1 Tax=Burkholderia alba TaxID=2683677 RepID=UPI002B06158B|nr:hypothetical protein [Burkholderia alba]